MGSAASVVDKRLSVGDLSHDQREVFDGIMSWIEAPAYGEEVLLTVGGVAGSGKSTLLGVLAAALAKTKKQIAYLAFTGRAASILDRKLRACGVRTTGLAQRGEGDIGEFFADDVGKTPFCGTIHRFLYKPFVDDETEELKGWSKRDALDREYSLIVIDEASMVGERIFNDLKGYGVPILAVGDHAQLPPVMDSGELMREPHLRLETIHRQAEGSPIIALSRIVREEGVLVVPEGNSTVRSRPRDEIGQVLKEAYGIAGNPLDIGVLCWMNRTRIRLNAEARTARGCRGLPQPGELLICLKNAPPVFNGMRGVVAAARPGDKPWHLEARLSFPEEGLVPLDYVLCAAQFNREKAFQSIEELEARGVSCRKMREAGDLYDFGYAMTTHKSQGSSFRHAIVYLDREERSWEEDYRRFLYTAVTRASEKLTVLR